MTYTVLRVSAGGQITLRKHHLERLGAESARALDDFAASQGPGVYRVWWHDQVLRSQGLTHSSLADGLPTRILVSPFAHLTGRLRKPPPPSPYDSVRIDGMVTLLTTAQGEAFCESCRASIVAWNGHELVLPPVEVPAVASVAEAAVFEAFQPRREAIMVHGHWPLLLINAVRGTARIDLEGRSPFPQEQRTRIESILRDEG